MGNIVDRIGKRFEGLSTAALCDASPLVRAFAPGLTALHPEVVMVGPAHTISCCNDYLTVIKGLAEAPAGSVLVIDGRRQSQAVFGELIAAEAKRRGLVGAIVDGAVRDLIGMRQVGFPVYYRWSHPRAGRAEVVEPPADIVAVCGTSVMSGDWIVGDADGIVVVPREHVESITAVAGEIQKVDRKVFENVRKGASLVEIMKLEEFLRQHEREISSRLDFHLSEE